MVPRSTQLKCQVLHVKRFSSHVGLCHRVAYQLLLDVSSLGPNGGAIHTYLDVGSFFLVVDLLGMLELSQVFQNR